ncbi:hypothetical protein [Kitasatospora sp. MAP5-34]|uniref:hypothetical protein n=1 Tax=Kitasatospora sp. MAP5-34 TaxID=3035102 RepID=UPI002474CACB|nr:hypothetical protein [Kitasatospora sp. MAP5-34]MDH6580634.1 hypothetical protein [Kitasatospora sp. MAP5-34]
MNRRRAVGLGTAAVCALAGLIGYRAAAGAALPGLVRTPVAVVLLSADGRGLSVAQSGECLGTGQLRVRQPPSAVVLDFRTDPPSRNCTGGAQQTVWSVRLATPLGDRPLIDANGGDTGDGDPVPYFRAADLPDAPLLPPGFHHAYDAPGYLGTTSAGQWSPAASELFLAGTARLRLVVEYGPHWPDDWPAAAPILVPVLGHLARVGPGGIAWQQRDASGSVRSYALLADPPLPTAQLVSMADQLHLTRASGGGPVPGGPVL